MTVATHASPKSAVLNKTLEEELTLLISSEDWKAVAAWFSYWDNLQDLADKVLLFGHFFLDEYFRDASPYFHRLVIIEYFKGRNSYTAAPRGFSKTTVLQTCILFECLIRSQKFIVLIEKTFTEAAEVLSAIRNECVENELLLACWGDVLNNERSVIANHRSKQKDAEGDLVVNGVRLRGKGFDTTIRGLKSGAYRPTRIVLDDVEQDAHINNPDQRVKYEDNFNKGIQPALDKFGTISVFGTLLHEDSLLSNLIRIHRGRVFRAYYLETEEDYEAAGAYTTEVEVPDVGRVRLLWASRWSWDELQRKKEDMRAKNQSTRAFEQEYRNYCIAEDERDFKWEWLHRADRRIPLKDLLASGKNFNGFTAIDTAGRKAGHADSTASVSVLIDKEENWYLVDVRDQKLNIKEQLDLVFDHWSKWSSHGLRTVGVEKKAYDDQFKPLLEDETRTRKKYPVVEELKDMGRNKGNRIRGALQARFEYGRIWVVTDANEQPVGDTEKLLAQLYDFPFAANDDLPDALAYVSDMAVSPHDEDKRRRHAPPQDDPWANEMPSVLNLDPSGETTIHGDPHPYDDDPFS